MKSYKIFCLGVSLATCFFAPIQSTEDSRYDRFQQQWQTDWQGEQYHNNSTMQFDTAMDLLKEWTFKGNERIADFGCGDGKITKIIAEKVPQGSVLGIDKSPSMVAFAQRTYPSTKYANLSFTHADITDVSHPQEFDLVFSSFCFNMITDLYGTFQNIANNLKPKGYFLACMGNDYYQPFATAIMLTLKSAKWEPLFKDLQCIYNYPDPTFLKPILQHTGFNVLSCERGHKTLHFKTKQELHDWFSVLAFGTHLRPVERTELLDDVVTTCLILNPAQPDGTIKLQIQSLTFIAQKNS